ncbi:MAG: hypothetical protein CL663_01560 [Bacteroidetes bacterium]|nr:hypothetical protein [Bacteroidota bacterium]
MKRANLYKTLITIGIVVFFGSTIYKSNFRILKERISQYDSYSYNIDLSPEKNYHFSVMGEDEETALQTWADLEFFVSLKNSEGKLIKEDSIYASTATERGGIRRAINGFEYSYIPETHENFILTVVFKSGDRVDVQVYEDIPVFIVLLPGLSCLLAFVSVFLLFKQNAKRNKP